jgi:RimJ/RimL family protein N-acetyltransferase
VKTFIIESTDGEAGQPIGLATLYNFRHRGCEIGIKIGPKDLRGRGYASEAVELLVSYCFGDLDLTVVRGSTLAHNTRMQRVFEKLGFKEVGDGSLISRFDNRRYAEIFYERRREDREHTAN